MIKQEILNELNFGEGYERECKLATGGLPESIWETYSSQVSGIDVQAGNTLVEQINVEIEKEKLRKQIADLELKARKEVQSKKKFEMVQRINQYKERW